MTPCEELGYKVGDVFRVSGGKSTFGNGSIVSLDMDDGSVRPLFRLLEGECDFSCAMDGGKGAFTHIKNVERHIKRETQDMIVKADGKPYATKASAEQQLSAKGLGDTHEVAGGPGGYFLQKKGEEQVTLRPGDYVKLDGMSDERCALVAEAMISAGAKPGAGYPYLSGVEEWDIIFWDAGNGLVNRSISSSHPGAIREVTVNQIVGREDIVTLQPGDYVPTKGMTEEQYHAVAEAFMAAGCRRDHWDDVPSKRFGHWDYLAWDSAGDVLGTNDAEGDTFLPSSRRQLTISQVLNATNAKRQDETEGAEQQDEPCSSVLDTLRLAQHRVNELSHELSVAQGVRDEALEAVRAELGEGFEISVVEGVPPGVDMSDPANWWEGDLLEALPGVNRTDIHAGGVYEFLRVDHSGDIRVKADDSGDPNWCHARDVKFHSRPTK